MAKQVVPVFVLLLLLLLDGGEVLSCFFLPLGMLVKSVLDLLLVLLDGGEPGVKMSILHPVVHDNLWDGCGSHG